MKKWVCVLLGTFLTAGYCQPTPLLVTERTITVNEKKASVFCIVQPDGTFGVRAKKGELFDVLLKNGLDIPTSIHWHGLILPNKEDGVAFITQFPIYPGASYYYRFPLLQAGTFWMHSHFSLQEQRLLSAPLILEGIEDAKIADQEVVILLSDFSFKSPEQIFEQLRCNKEMNIKKGADLVEVEYDAFLANARTLSDPDVFEVMPGKKIRLRFINAASATNFFLSLGQLEGEAIAVDGNRIEPLRGSRFDLAEAQRIDILVTIPERGGAFPILAQGEGTAMQTGIILATREAHHLHLSSKAHTKAGALDNTQEKKLRALFPLPPKPVDRQVMIELGGDMSNYVWTLNGQSWPNVTPIVVEKGERVEITFNNVSTMAHPMHFHGHVFQVTAIDGIPIKGAMRDTVLVLPGSTTSIQFDADNMGVWPLHCHVLYHLEAGMLTVVRYKGYTQPL